MNPFSLNFIHTVVYLNKESESLNKRWYIPFFPIYTSGRFCSWDFKFSGHQQSHNLESTACWHPADWEDWKSVGTAEDYGTSNNCKASDNKTYTDLFKQASSYCWTVGNFFPMLKKTNGPWMWKPKSYQHRSSRKKLSLRNKAQNRQQQHGPSSKMHQVGNTHQESKQGLMNTAGSEVRVLVSWRLGRQCDSVILKSNCQVSGCCNSKQLYSPIRQKAFNASPLNSLRPNHRYDS